MTNYRQCPPQMGKTLFLTDGGLETDLIFNHGFELPAFAAHTLLESAKGRAALTRYFESFLALARYHGTGFILDCPTWRAQGSFAGELNISETDLWQINRDAVAFSAVLRARAVGGTGPVVLNGAIGPCGDAYAPTDALNAVEAQDYHGQQVGWLAATQVDCVTALTFTHASEAIGVVNAARVADLPVIVSFTVETDGCLPSGQPLGDAINEVDAATAHSVAYYMINCAHPDHFRHLFADQLWTRRLRGLRCNASRCSHAELDQADTLDAGDAMELATLYRDLVQRMPWLNIVGGCCGTDLSHVAEIARVLTGDDGRALRRA